MASLSGYGFLELVTPYPEGSGGRCLNDNFQRLYDAYNSGVLTDGSRGFTDPQSGVAATAGYHLGRLDQITAEQVGSGLPYWNAGNLRGSPIASSSPDYTNVLMWDGSEWAPSGLPGGLDGSLYSLVDGTRGYTGAVSGIPAVDGYQLATLAQIPPSGAAGGYQESPRLLQCFAPEQILFDIGSGFLSPSYFNEGKRSYYQYLSNDGGQLGIISSMVSVDYNGFLKLEYLWSAQTTGVINLLYSDEIPDVPPLSNWNLSLSPSYRNIICLSGHYTESIPGTIYLYSYQGGNYGNVVSTGAFDTGGTINLTAVGILGVSGTVHSTWDGMPGGTWDFLLYTSGADTIGFGFYIERPVGNEATNNTFGLVANISEGSPLHNGEIIRSTYTMDLSSGTYADLPVRIGLTYNGGTFGGTVNLYQINVYDRL